MSSLDPTERRDRRVAPRFDPGIAFVALRALVARAVPGPVFVGLGLGLLALGPLASALSPLDGPGPALAAGRAWTLPAGLLGVALAGGLLSRRRAFLRELPEATRWRLELGALLLAALQMQLPMWVGVLGASGGVLPGAGTVGGVLLLDLHLAALALLLGRWRAPAGVRTAALVAIVGLLPGLFADVPPGGRLRALVDPGLALESLRAFDGGLSAALSATVSAAALLGASYLLAVHPLDRSRRPARGAPSAR